MAEVVTLADKRAIEGAMPWAERAPATTLYECICRAADRFPDRPAVSFQLTSGPGDAAETLSWAELRAEVTRTANMLRALGVGEGDTVAYLLPNATETVLTLLGGAVAGIVNPVNPLLEAEQIGGILKATNAKVLVTLKSMPKTDVAQKAAEALKLAPNVETVIEVDLKRYLKPPKSWIVSLIRPKMPKDRPQRILDFTEEKARHRSDALDFPDATGDRVAAYFHTGGTTGLPKVAQHRYSGFVYNGWVAHELLFTENDVLLCPLPLFHVFAAYAVMMAAVASGGHVVLPTPQGYRGDGVFDNFWKLIERWGVTFLVTVPTAVSALMQRKVDADVSTLKTAISGSAALPVELYTRFRDATGVEIMEGYGLTEATCLVACNPYHGEKRIGSIGLPLPYTDVRILHCAEDGTVEKECETDEVGEICVRNPGVYAGRTYVEGHRNAGLFADGEWLRTGDLGRVDAQGYIWITGRAKDIIIRSGHNIDPAVIEEALMAHPAVAFVGAIGQPDPRTGEMPCAYVELVAGGQVNTEQLLRHARETIPEHAAIPKYVEIVDELPKTAVGKILKNELRKCAIARVYSDALAAADIPAGVPEVYEDPKRGLVARVIRRQDGSDVDGRVAECLGHFTLPWEWKD
ncbi:MAG TPA: acyl-CoA synthetase [Rhodobacteraceae bacterium]|jgi:fatty-acyl-CoA synthase|nr:acyl-CoA synthetase [Paracoccaceae bacterium]HBG97262.1 acyl-CoA synthetase [Paracoccaceae bacterium]